MDRLAVTGSFVAQFCALGVLYSSGLYIPQIQEAFDCSRASAAQIPSLITSSMLLSALGAGAAFDRYFALIIKARPGEPSYSMFLPLVIGCILTSLGLFLLSISDSITTACFASLPIGAGCAIFALPAITVVQSWYDDSSRATATGLAMAGSGVGNFTFAIVLQSVIERHGFRAALRREALFVLVVSSLGSALIWRKGVDVKGKEVAGQVTAESAVMEDEMSFIAVTRSGPFRCVMLFKALFAFGYLVFFVHIFAFVEELGFSDSFAALALALIGAASTVGRVVLGICSDKWGAVNNLKGSMCVLVVCVLAWPHLTSKGLVLATCVLYGFFAGAFPSLPPSILASYYADVAPRSIFKIVSSGFVVEAVGATLGPVGVGYMYDVQGDYGMASVATAAFMIAGVCVLFTIEEKNKFLERTHAVHVKARLTSINSSL